MSSWNPLELAHQQVGDHLTASDIAGAPEGVEVERAKEGIGVAEEKHGRDPTTRVLEGEATAIGHLVLLNVAAAQVVHATLRVHLGLILARYIGGLGAEQNVEVVIGGVTAGVALGADGGTCGK